MLESIEATDDAIRFMLDQRMKAAPFTAGWTMLYRAGERLRAYRDELLAALTRE